MTTQTAYDAPSAADLERDWRFAELVMRTRLEPDLHARYAADARCVLAEFGLPLPAGAQAPLLHPAGHTGVVIEHLDRPLRETNALFTLCPMELL